MAVTVVDCGNMKVSFRGNRLGRTSKLPSCHYASFAFFLISSKHLKRFYEVNKVNKFQFSRGVHRGKVDKENEFKVSSTFAVRNSKFGKPRHGSTGSWLLERNLSSSFNEFRLSVSTFPFRLCEDSFQKWKQLLNRTHNHVPLLNLSYWWILIGLGTNCLESSFKGALSR